MYPTTGFGFGANWLLMIGLPLIIGLWALILPIWFLLAIAHGASCGGG